MNLTDLLPRWGVYVKDNMAYVTDDYDWISAQPVLSGLRVIDVSNPASPTEVGA